MARCAAGCGFYDEVHDFGCPERFKGWPGQSPELLQLYGTETPAEAQLVDQLLMGLLVEADMAEWDPEAVQGADAQWLVLRRAIRELGNGVLDRPLPLRVRWNTEQESPYLEEIE